MKKPPVHNNQYFAMSNVIIIQMLDFNEKKTIHKFENIVPKLYARFLYASPLIMTRAHSFFSHFSQFHCPNPGSQQLLGVALTQKLKNVI